MKYKETILSCCKMALLWWCQWRIVGLDLLLQLEIKESLRRNSRRKNSTIYLQRFYIKECMKIPFRNNILIFHCVPV